MAGELATVALVEVEACREVLVLVGATAATFFGGSTALVGGAALGVDSTGAFGTDVAVSTLATVVVSAAVASGFAGVALALGATADLSVK